MRPMHKLSKQFYESIADGLHIEDVPFIVFAEHAWQIIEPNKTLARGYYIDAICDHLEAIECGAITRLIINMPPRYAKSNFASVIFPPWCWTKRPEMRFTCASYSGKLAIKHSVARRRIIESAWFRTKWGMSVAITTDQNQKSEFENTSRGHMTATSVGGTVTGTGGDIIIADDLLDPRRADSPVMREATTEFFDKTLSTRLNDKKLGRIIVIEHRLHKDDVTGHLLNGGDTWHKLELPAIAEQPQKIIFPMSQRVVERETGDILCPERESEEQILKQKRIMGTRAFVAQYQQRPTAEEAALFKRQWWKFWTQRPAGFDLAVQSWDMSFKKTAKGSYVVGQAWWKRGLNYYLMGQWRNRVDFSDTVMGVLTFSGAHPETTAKLIEDAANGPAIISHLQHKIDGIIPVKPLGSKLARAQAVTPLVEAGNVILPHPSIAPWVNDFIEEAAVFRGEDDEINDQVDAMTQAVNYLREAAIYVTDDDDMEVGSFIDEMPEANLVGGFVG